MTGAQLNINVMDAAVFTILGLSALIAFFRGFVRELLSLGAWVGAAMITIYLFPHSADLVKHHVKNENLAAGMAALGTYIAALIAISIINSVIMRYLRTGMEVGLLDNFLGLIFGLVRGAFTVSLGFLIFSAVMSKDNAPQWYKDSATKPYLQQGADMLVSIAPKYLNDLEGFVKKEDGDKDKSDSDNGYKPENQHDLDRLIESNQPQGGAFHRD